MDLKQGSYLTVLLAAPLLICVLVAVIIIFYPSFVVAALILGLIGTHAMAFSLPSFQSLLAMIGGLLVIGSIFTASMITKGRTSWILTIILLITFFAWCIFLFVISQSK